MDELTEISEPTLVDPSTGSYQLGGDVFVYAMSLPPTFPDTDARAAVACFPGTDIIDVIRCPPSAISSVTGFDEDEAPVRYLVEYYGLQDGPADEEWYVAIWPIHETTYFHPADDAPRHSDFAIEL